ncbi:Pepco domain-containing protein [Streptomyces flaveolus]|uniref:Pepco domain-containing protein n=1 Tax=Streptomyces flaveolus TaxID=67297 RepID=UPI0033E30197
MNETGLQILVNADDEDFDAVTQARGGTKGRRRTANGEVAAVPVRVEQLRANLESTVDALREVFGRISDAGGRFPLREVQVSFEVSAKGGIRLIGTSEVEGKGGITMVFGAGEGNR